MFQPNHIGRGRVPYLNNSANRIISQSIASRRFPFHSHSFACHLRLHSHPFHCRYRTPATLLATMSSDQHQPSFQKLRELTDEPDFEAILSPDGCLSICGFGSLLSEKSARSTFPELVNIRIGRLTGFRRIFTVVGGFFFSSGIANADTEEVAGLAVEPCEGETIIVTVFEIKKSEIPAFIKREREYRFLAVFPETLDGKPFPNPAVLCAAYSDEEFFKSRCKEGKEIYFQEYREYKNHKIWRDDALPCRVYLRHCVLAAKGLGDAAYNNFLDNSFLGDRKTTIRQYLEKVGTSILDEEPPESLKARYGG